MALSGVSLCKTFGGRPVVHGVDLRVDSGTIVALLGRNGAGKSTTFQMIAGLLPPDSGCVLIDGADVTGEPLYRRARAGLTSLPQERSIFQHLTVRQNVRVGLEERGVARRERRARVEELLTQFGLTHIADTRACDLSGGEARKVEITRPMATTPRYVLLDEPFAGIDPLHCLEVRLLLERVRDRGVGLLVSDHNVEHVFGVMDRGYVIDAGRVLASGTSESLAADEHVRQAFLGPQFSFHAGERRSAETSR